MDKYLLDRTALHRALEKETDKTAALCRLLVKLLPPAPEPAFADTAEEMDEEPKKCKCSAKKSKTKAEMHNGVRI